MSNWPVRVNVRAQMRVINKRILRRYGNPPDKQARAAELVLEQDEVPSNDWPGAIAGFQALLALCGNSEPLGETAA